MNINYYIQSNENVKKKHANENTKLRPQIQRNEQQYSQEQPGFFVNEDDEDDDRNDEDDYDDGPVLKQPCG